MNQAVELHRSMIVLAALGLLAGMGARAEEVDTSQWKCEKCPDVTGFKAAIEAGAGYASRASTSFGTYTGLQKKGAHLVLGGDASYRGDDGYHADAEAADLGIDTRWLAARTGREGSYSLRLGYAEIPRYFADAAQTPFLGVGSGTLQLPAGAGFPAASTAAMPLAATLQPVDIGYKDRRFDLGGAWVGPPNWTYRVNWRRDVRDGTRPAAGAFVSTATQLVLPVDQTTDSLEVSVAYATPQWQAMLGYQWSAFRNRSDSLVWDNPFLPARAGASRGQLAQAPDNQYQQLRASIGYQLTPAIKASADIAYGIGRQNADFLAPTLNATLAPMVPVSPATSLADEVMTFNLNARISAEPIDRLKVVVSYARDVRDNETAIRAFPQVESDVFLAPATRSNTPFGIWQDRFKLSADYRGPRSWRFHGALDWDQRERSYQEVVRTRETTLWGRATVQAVDSVSLAFDLAYGDRASSTYGVAYWFGSPQNPLLRKSNLAPRQRTKAGARADWTLSEAMTLALGADWVNDNYKDTPIGLNESKTSNLYAEFSAALSDWTQLHTFAQGQWTNSRQTGSQAWRGADWTGRIEERFDVVGIGIKHAAIRNRLDLGADLSRSRSRSDTTVQTAMFEPAYPANTTALDLVKLFASYKVNDGLSLLGSFAHESARSAAWHLDSVQPGTVSDLLAFGNAPARYRVTVVRLSARYRF